MVDDHSVVREGIRSVLAATPGFAVVAEAANAPEALERAGAEQPDVVVLDISMPGLSGLQVVGELRRRSPKSRILILSIHDNMEYVLESVRAGAHGYLRKDSTPGELREAVRAVHQGNTYYSPPVARQLTAALLSGGAPEPAAKGLALLTTREREVLVRVARGLTNKETAAELGISARTVESHRESLSRKLGVRSVAELTRFALESGLLKES